MGVLRQIASCQSGCLSCNLFVVSVHRSKRDVAVSPSQRANLQRHRMSGVRLIPSAMPACEG